MTNQLDQLGDFLLQFDALKSIERRTYINGGERRENSAEHSWHLALACWVFAEKLPADIDLLKLIQLALVHDLGEIDAGDTFLYSSARSDAHVEERKCVARLAQHPGNAIVGLPELWEEQETGTSREAQLLKVVDRLLPFLHNMASEGRAWRDNDICKSQVLKMHQFVADAYPDIYKWVSEKVDHAAAKGWLRDA